MLPAYESQLRRLARVLAEIAHTLESVDGAYSRVERAMTLLGEVVPYRRCALLEVDEDGTEMLYIVPEQPHDERLLATMRRVFGLVSRAEQIGRSSDAVPSMSLPVIGLDTTIGVIRVEPADTVYDVTHLRVLSVVAAQLGAYLTTLRLRERDRKREASLAAANEFQQLLAGIVSHDLRNPLAVIMAVAGNLLEKTTDAKQAESLRRALRNAQQAARLIADLADVTEARVSGTLSLAPRAHSATELFTTIVEDLRSAHPSATIELFCDIDASLEVTWDVERVTQVLTNLVNNAIAHGAVNLPIHVSVMLHHEHLKLVVHNYGPPIPPELRPTIFDPFRHGATERQRPSSARGLGLGLFIVDQIVRAHGGTIAVRSDVAGTAFDVRLPRECTHQRTLIQPRGGSAAHPLVMIVDDDEDVRIALRGILQKRGFEVVSACDGAEALELLRGGARPKVVLLDLAMPRMDGATLCDMMQRDQALADIPIVVISADTAAAVRVSRERASAFLAKPVSLERLLATIDTLH